MHAGDIVQFYLQILKNWKIKKKMSISVFSFWIQINFFLNKKWNLVLLAEFIGLICDLVVNRNILNKAKFRVLIISINHSKNLFKLKIFSLISKEIEVTISNFIK